MTSDQLKRIFEEAQPDFSAQICAEATRADLDPEAIADNLKERIPPLVELGGLEPVGRGRGVRYLLAPCYYKAIGKPGAYTRKRGLDRDTNKALLLKHLERSKQAGSPLSELNEVLPALSTKELQHLLAEMKAQGVVHVLGVTKGARWFAGPERAHGDEP